MARSFYRPAARGFALASALTSALATGGLVDVGVGSGVAHAHDAPGVDSGAGAGVGSGLPSGPAAAGTGVVVGSAGAAAAPAPSRWRGSALLFDQSATTQTLHIGADYQSSDPTYEWWFAFKPRYFLVDRKSDAVSVNLWMNLYLELTNSDTTTRTRELLIGPTYLWASYARTLRERGAWKTTMSVGPRVTLPTDKAAWDAGQLIGLGASAGVAQNLPLRGLQARWWSAARVGITAIFNHPFARATSGVNPDIQQQREDVGGRAILSDQLTGAMNVQNALNLAFSGDVQVAPRWDLSLSYVLLNAWTYAPPAVPCVAILTGCAPVESISDPTTFRVNTWATAAVTYDVIDDFSVSVGYYNLSNQIGPDGTRRNPLWSPAGRFFLTLTGNLDVIYGRIARAR